MSLEIIEYQPAYKSYFKDFNVAWLEEFFTVEPIDKLVLEHPEDYILKDGGKIYFAKHNDRIIGTVALKVVSPGVFEMTKMAVDKPAQGLGAGKLLCQTAIQKAKELGAEKLILYSQTGLKTAIAIYRKMGFIEIPLEPGKYARADIKMELPLK